MSSIQNQPTTETEEELGPLPPELWPEVEHLVTEDDTPVDNIFSEKQQRLLTESLYTSWSGPGEERPFLVLANVGLFFAVGQPPLVPDVLLSLDVRVPANVWPKANRSYFVWMYGKPPDVVIEVVSNRQGGEDSHKLATYAWIGIPYYVIFDPEQQLSEQVLRVYALHVGEYQLQSDAWFGKAALGLTLWQGTYEELEATWLRWCAQDGTLIPTGAERSARAEQQAAAERHQREQAEERAAQAEQQTAQERTVREQAEQRASQAEQQATEERRQRERLAARLRELGIDPDQG
jgi:Uma2 family endonuclease